MTSIYRLSILHAIALPLSSLTAAEALLFPNSDFESGSLEGWVATGPAFDRQPTFGDNTAARGNVSSLKQGDYWIGTYEDYDGVSGNPGDDRGDIPTGTLTSQEFTISKRYISFLVGGGNLPAETGVNLLCEGQEYPMGTGFNSEAMVQVNFDAETLLGKTAQVVIYDQATGGWGHVNADNFLASDEPILEEVGELEFLPGIPKAGAPGVGYNQPLRPQFHFTSRRGWINDPNGMVFDGEDYHLFFQHNPLGTDWGNMTWGHAISKDMIHWRQVDHALLPYRTGIREGTIFSGTAVVDHNNSLGVQVGPRKTLVAFYTYANNQPSFYQAMAYSTDGGVTWKYHDEGRPVVPNQGFDAGERDPKVFWHEETQKWVMVLWVQNDPGRVRIFTSTNLTDWNFASDLLRDWAFECMDVLFLPVDGDPNQTKCVIYDASFDYEIGSFDGSTFTTESGPFLAGKGSFYAAQTFNQAPDGRAVQIGWMIGGPNSAAAYGLPFNKQMAFPCDLTLRTTPDGVRLCVWPIPEIASLVDSTEEMEDQTLTPESNLLSGMGELDLVDLTLEFDPGSATEIVIDLPRTTVRYDVVSRTLAHTGTSGNQDVTLDGPLSPRDGRVSIRLLLDRLSIEAFGFGGEHYGSHYVSPSNGTAEPSIYAVGGEALVHSLSVKKLHSSWTPEAPLSTILTNGNFEGAIPLASPFERSVGGWETFGGFDLAVGTLDDGGDVHGEAQGYPEFSGLGAVVLKTRNDSTENEAGVIQSLGFVALRDVGKSYALSAELGARIIDGPGNYIYSGEMSVAFRKGVTTGISGNGGTLLGSPGVRMITADDSELPSLSSVEFVRESAAFTPGLEDVGTEVFAVIKVKGISNSASADGGEKEYLVDDVVISVAGAELPSGSLAYEGFDYPSGEGSLSGNGGGHGWSGDWQTINNGSSDVVAGSLLAGSQSPVGYDSESIGGSSDLLSGRRVGRLLDTSANGPLGLRGFVDQNGRIGKDGSTLYVSFLQQPNDTALFYEFEFHRDNLGDPGRIAGIGNDQGGVDVNFRAPDGSQTAIGEGSTAVGLYVVRIDFKPGDDDVFIYRNPTTMVEPEVPSLSKLAAGDMAFDGISFGAFLNGRTVKHDEIRFAASWSDALAIDPFTAWGAEQGLDGSAGKEAGYNADPDGDSIINGLEWILGGDPLTQDESTLYSMDSTDGLSLYFTRNEMSVSAGLTLQWSLDLSGEWHDVPISGESRGHPGGVTVTIDQAPTPDSVTVRIPSLNAPDGRIFARFQTSAP